jgi:hypothetical protein
VAHALNFLTDYANYHARDVGAGLQWHTWEEKYVITGIETTVAKELGEPTRFAHGDDGVELRPQARECPLKKTFPPYKGDGRRDPFAPLAPGVR